jgi:hypothetical protein
VWQREDWWLRVFKSLTYWQAQQVYDPANDDEARLWRHALIEKRNRLLRRDPQKLRPAAP